VCIKGGAHAKSDIHSESVVIQFAFLLQVEWPLCEEGMDMVEVAIWFCPFLVEEAIEKAE
jgi:hypothetical protein